MSKKIPTYNFKYEIINQLQSHYFNYKDQNRPIEREFILMLADIIDNSVIYTIPSDFDLYLPFIKIDYGYEYNNNTNWILQYKKNNIFYCIVDTNKKEIIEKIINLSKIKITYDIDNITLMFYKLSNEWIFPTHFFIIKDKKIRSIKFLENKRSDESLINSYIEYSKLNIIKSFYFSKNKKINFKIRNKNNNMDLIPYLFYEKEKPKYKKETLLKIKEKYEKEKNILKEFSASVLS